VASVSSFHEKQNEHISHVLVTLYFLQILFIKIIIISKTKYGSCKSESGSSGGVGGRDLINHASMNFKRNLLMKLQYASLYRSILIFYR